MVQAYVENQILSSGLLPDEIFEALYKLAKDQTGIIRLRVETPAISMRLQATLTLYPSIMCLITVDDQPIDDVNEYYKPLCRIH